MPKKIKPGRRPFPPGVKKIALSVYVYTEQKKLLDQQAYNERRTTSEIVRDAINLYYERRANTEPSKPSEPSKIDLE